MIAWPSPQVPELPGQGRTLHLHDTATGTLQPVGTTPAVGMYVCGITPYDATHLGHAATYLAFDLVNRVWRDAGREVTYVQNVTDVDDPLLERAAATGVDWRHLAADQTALFGEDMTALGVLAPDVYLGAVETIPLVVRAVQRLTEQGAAYSVPVEVPARDGVDAAGGEPGGGADVYFDVSADPRFGGVSGWDRATMRRVFGERGGDPDRAGKRDPLDALLWRAARAGEPSWDGGSLGPGRPGWHVECVAIALEHLPQPFDVQGGGSDLVFPHHEMGASHAHVLTSAWPYARTYAHAGMVALDGQKMSKSLGNLVLVSRLRAQGVDAAAIRLAVLAHHYRSDWEWTAEGLTAAQARLDRWQDAVSRNSGPDGAATLDAVRERLADDLDAPGALAAVDAWVERQVTAGGDDPAAPGLVARTANALLGVRL